MTHMAAIAKAISRAFTSTSSSDTEVLKQLVMFAAAGLLIGILAMTWGLDLSPGLF
jgi:hypothetical protein